MIPCPCFSSLKQYTTELCLNLVSQNSAVHIWCIPSCSYIICTSFYRNFTKFFNTTQLSKKDYDRFCYLVRSLNSIKTCSRKSYLTKILFYSLTFFSTNSGKTRWQRPLKWKFYIMINNSCLKCNFNSKILTLASANNKCIIFSSVLHFDVRTSFKNGTHFL